MNIIRRLNNPIFDLFQNEFINSSWNKIKDNSNVVTSQWAPFVDVKEERDKFIVFADIPGVDPKEIEISMENSVLTLKGHRSIGTQETEQNYTRIERSYGRFYRQFTLPETADDSKITAKSKHGVLEIKIPKKERCQPNQIDIDVQE